MSANSDFNVINMVNDVEKLIVSTYATMSIGQAYMLRQTLQRFFQGRRAVNI
jgi:hypothetical protein